MSQQNPRPSPPGSRPAPGQPQPIGVLLRYLNDNGMGLWLEDGQLRYRALANVLDLPAFKALKARKHEATRLMQVECPPHLSQALVRQEVSSGPLTLVQRAWWRHRGLRLMTPNIHRAAMVLAEVDPARLRKAVDALLVQHPILGTRIDEGPDGPVQFETDAPRLTILERPTEASLDSLAFDAQQELDLPAGETLRLIVSPREGERTLLVLVTPELLIGWHGAQRMLNDLIRNYQSPGREPPPRENVVRPLDHALWEAPRFRSRSADRPPPWPAQAWEPAGSWSRKAPDAEPGQLRRRCEARASLGASHTRRLRQVSEQERVPPMQMVATAIMVAMAAWRERELVHAALQIRPFSPAAARGIGACPSYYAPVRLTCPAGATPWALLKPSIEAIFEAHDPELADHVAEAGALGAFRARIILVDQGVSKPSEAPPQEMAYPPIAYTVLPRVMFNELEWIVHIADDRINIDLGYAEGLFDEDELAPLLAQVCDGLQLGAERQVAPSAADEGP